MRDRIAALAESNGRSMTAEVVAALEQHLKGPSRLDALEAFIEKHRENIEAFDALWSAGQNLEGAVTDLEERVFGHQRTRATLG